MEVDTNLSESSSSLISENQSDNEEELIEKMVNIELIGPINGGAAVVFNADAVANISKNDSILHRQLTNIQFNEDLIRKSLESSLNTDFNALIKSELNFYQKEKPIVISEQTLIDECLMLMSGIKSNLLFQFDPRNDSFTLNKKLRLQHLHKELKDCLKNVTHYSKIVMRLEFFVNNVTERKSNFSTQVYETFGHCITAYLRYYKETLNLIGVDLIKKEIKFTLVDFLLKIRDRFFTILDLLNIMLKQIYQDTHKPPYAKSINLILVIHRHLVDTFLSHNYAKIEGKFLMWLLLKCLRPFLSWMDTFMREGVFLDTKNELGFKRNLNIQLDNVEYWKHGYEMLIDKQHLVHELPLFMRIILSCAFKICKHMEIITLLGNFNQHSNIYNSFMDRIKHICPYIDEPRERSELELATDIMNQSILPMDPLTQAKYTLLELNFKRLSRTDDTIIRKHNDNVSSIEDLFESHYNSERSSIDASDFNVEKQLETILHDCLIKYVEYSSTILITKLFEKYNILKFFEFLHSYYLLKSNETMFVFAKQLFENIQNYELYQEDAILNSLFYKAASSVFTTDALQKKLVFNSNLVTVHYDQTDAALTKPSAVNSSRLINSLRLRVKIRWPLNVIITKNDLDAYNHIFGYIMQIKQVKYDLDSIELHVMDIKKPPPNFAGIIDELSVKKMLFLRFKLMNFMNSAHDLICNQIYECDDEFLTELKTQTDIDEIVELHQKFLGKLVKSSLLQHKVFQQSFVDVFNLVLDFCDLWRKGMDQFVEPMARARVLDLECNVKHYFEFIHSLLSAIINKNHSVYFQSLISALG